jgi:hypothetical protein
MIPALLFAALCLALPLAPWPALVGLGVLWLATPGWGRR